VYGISANDAEEAGHRGIGVAAMNTYLMT